MLPGSPLVFLALAAGGASLALAGAAWYEREEPGATAFGAMMAGNALWGLSYGVSLAVFDPAVRRLFELPIELAQAVVAPAWLLFALGYTGRGERVTRRLVAALLVVPALTLVAVYTNPSHGLLWTDYRIVPTWGAATVLFDPGPWYYLHALYGYALIGTGIALVLDMLLEGGRLYRDQALALAVGSAFPTVAHVGHTLGLGPVPQVNATPLALVVTGATFGYALFRFELFGLVPATRALGRRAAIDDVGVAVVVVDDERRLVEVNEAAAEGFDLDESALGEPADDYLPPGFDLGATPQLLTGADRRRFEVVASPVRDQHGRTLGHTVVLTDVTERERRRQQLEVLNRVLRHNLRNDAGVVLGYADLLAGSLDGEDARKAEVIADRAGDLVDLGEKARDVDAVMSADPGERRRFAVDALLERAVGEVDAAGTDGSVVLDVPEGVEVETNGRVLAAVVANLVENGLEHADVEGTPRVEVSARVVAGAVEIAVADEGPGVPDHELETIASGRETPLEHGSGLGLWVVHWGVRTLGGEVTFADRDPRGAVVTVRLPLDDTAGGEPTDGRPSPPAAADAGSGAEGGTDATPAEATLAGENTERADAEGEAETGSADPAG